MNAKIHKYLMIALLSAIAILSAKAKADVFPENFNGCWIENPWGGLYRISVGQNNVAIMQSLEVANTLKTVGTLFLKNGFLTGTTSLSNYKVIALSLSTSRSQLNINYKNAKGVNGSEIWVQSQCPYWLPR